MRAAYLDSIAALRLRQLSPYDVSSRVRLSKTPEQYLATRDSRRELSCEALLANGRPSWTIGERVRVYRTQSGQGRIAPDPDALNAMSLPPHPHGSRVHHVLPWARNDPQKAANWNHRA